MQHDGYKGVLINSGAPIIPNSRRLFSYYHNGIDVSLGSRVGKLDINVTGSITANSTGINAITKGTGDATINLDAPLTAYGSSGMNLYHGILLHHQGTGDAVVKTSQPIIFDSFALGLS